MGSQNFVYLSKSISIYLILTQSVVGIYKFCRTVYINSASHLANCISTGCSKTPEKLAKLMNESVHYKNKNFKNLTPLYTLQSQSISI